MTADVIDPAASPPPDSLDYFDQVNQELLRRLPRGVGRLLEVGCGTGSLGAAYKQDNPAAEYWGIELYERAAERAAERLDRVLCANAEDPDLLSAIAPGTIDCLVYGDTIEHFRDPWLTLRHHSQWLVAGGQVVACVPNVQHWSLVHELLRGHWRYADRGLLDRTHLRFFTREGVQDLFTEAGLHLEVIDSSYLGPPCPGESYEFQVALAGAIAATGGDAEQFQTQSEIFHHLVLARKPAAVVHPGPETAVVWF